LLSAMVAEAGASEMETPVLVSLDKLDKIGRDGVDAELEGRGLSEESRSCLWALLEQEGEAALDHLESSLGEGAAQAIENIRQVLSLAYEMGVDRSHLTFDPTLARGLDYYTGPVFEAVVTEPHVGSIAGGGRYDGLIGMFCKRDVPAVGVSLGLERILVVMEELGMLNTAKSQSKALVTVFSPELRSESLEVVTRLRAAGVNAQMSMDAAKLGKQFKRADSLGIPYAVVIGPDEAASGQVVLKDLGSGEQSTLDLEGLLQKLA